MTCDFGASSSTGGWKETGLARTGPLRCELSDPVCELEVMPWGAGKRGGGPQGGAESTGVSGRSGCCDESPHSGGLVSSSCLFLTVLEAERAKTQPQCIYNDLCHDQGAGRLGVCEPPLPIQRGPSSRWVLAGRKGQGCFLEPQL